MINSDNTLILCIDIQEKLLNAVFNKDILENKACIISKAAEILKLPVLITEQYPKGLGRTVSGVYGNLPSAELFEKLSFNALSEHALYDKLVELNRPNIVIIGIETHICVYQTAVALLGAGYNVTVIKDACGSRYEDEYISGLHCIEKAGADIKTTEMFVFELLKSSKHPNFKEIQSLIK